MINTILFDLDGTLLNTIDDLTDSVNFALQELGFAQRTVSEVKSFVGEGVKLLIERALPKGQAYFLPQCLAIFESHYNKNKNNKTRAYDGIATMIDSVKKAGFKTAIVSNKYDAAVQALHKTMFSGIDVAVGEQASIPKKPAADMVLYALKQLSAKREEAVYVGDSDIDILTARNSGLPIVAVSWGFRERALLESLNADVIIDHPQDLVNAVKELSKTAL